MPLHGANEESAEHVESQQREKKAQIRLPTFEKEELKIGVFKVTWEAW